MILIKYIYVVILLNTYVYFVQNDFVLMTCIYYVLNVTLKFPVFYVVFQSNIINIIVNHVNVKN